MNEIIPAEAQLELTLERFFEQLTWPKLEQRIREALKHPDRSVPSEIHCPAVMSLASQVMGGLVASAIQRPGQPVSAEETFSFDQRVAVMRLLEAIISEYEDWRNRHMLVKSPGVSVSVVPTRRPG